MDKHTRARQLPWRKWGAPIWEVGCSGAAGLDGASQRSKTLGETRFRNASVGWSRCRLINGAALSSLCPQMLSLTSSTLTQRVLSTYIVECRVSILGITIMI